MVPVTHNIINKTTPSQGQWCNFHHLYNSQHIQTTLIVPRKEVQSRLTSAVNTRGHSKSLCQGTRTGGCSMW